MSSDKSYYVCQHPAHGALAEILSSSELEKAWRTRPDLIVLAGAGTKAEALELIRRAAACFGFSDGAGTEEQKAAFGEMIRRLAKGEENVK